MDQGALQLKPFVTIDSENREPETPRTDQAIRPYTNCQSDLEPHVNSDEGGRLFRAKGDVEGRDRSKPYRLYTSVIIRAPPLSCGVVLVDGLVFYQRSESSECVEENVTTEKESGADVVKILGEDFHLQKMLDIMSAARSLEEEFEIERLTRKDGLMYHVVKSQVAGTAYKVSERDLKECGEGQRRRKLDGLLKAFDTFRFLTPPPLTLAVFPVSRQSIVLTQGSDRRTPSSSQPGHEQRPWPPDSLYGRPWADFNQELYRLGTFMNIAPNFPVFAVRLAQAGFICLPEGVIVCYFCDIERNEWNVGESPEEIHRQLSPSCSILTGVNCHNVPVSTQNEDRVQAAIKVWSLPGPSLLSGHGQGPTGQTSAATGDDSSHALQVPPQPLSSDAQVTPAARSVVVGPRQTVNASSDITADGPNTAAPSAQSVGNGRSGLENQNAETDNSQANNQQQPNAGSVVGSSSRAGSATVARILDGTAQPEAPGSASRSPPSAREARTGQQVVTYQQLGIITDPPKRSEMVMVSARVDTFRNWPATLTQTPQALAQAGFYYAGYADCGRCFHCGGGLKNWEPADDPWVEHARWFDKCAYVKQCQGQDFIDIVLELNSRGERQQISMAQVREEMRNRRAGGDHIQEPVVDPAISSVLQTGYSQEAVDTAMQRLQRQGLLLTTDRLVDFLEADGAVPTEGAESSAEPADRSEVEELVTENNEIRQQRLCKICLDKEVRIVFLPCGHLVCCAECSPAMRSCPMCRQRIKGRVRAFPI